MERRYRASVVGLIAGGLFLLGAARLAADDKHAHADHCARACADCMRECEDCGQHCLQQVAMGNKDHLRTARTCLDCAEVCATAAKIVSRNGPLAVPICDACVRACETCATDCEKHARDEHMQRCARACRECAKACREMIK